MSYARNAARLARSGAPTVDAAEDCRDLTFFGDLVPELVVSRGALSAGDGGTGLWRWDPDSAADDNVGSVLLPAGRVGAGRWRRLETAPTNVRWFGAQGDGVTDDTPAIQAAIDDAFAPGGSGHVHFPVGTYQISSALLIPKDNYGWTISGASRNGSVIRQVTSDTPIFEINGVQHTFTICDLFCTYSVAQSSSETDAICFKFCGTEGTNVNCYEWKADNLRFSNCFSCFSTITTRGVLLWGFLITNVWANAFSGRFLSSRSSVGAGQPRCIFDNISLIVSAVPSSGVVFDMPAAGVYFGTIEITSHLTGCQIFKNGSGNIFTARSISLESIAISESSTPNNRVLFELQNSFVKITQLIFSSQGAIGIDVSSPMYLLEVGSAIVDIDYVKFGVAMTGAGNVHLFKSSPTRGRLGYVSAVGSSSSGAGVFSPFLTPVTGSVQSERVSYDHVMNRNTSWMADADVTISPGSPSELFFGSQSADRVVIFPDNAGWFPSGTGYRIRKTHATYAMTVRLTGGTVLGVLAAGDVGFVDVAYSRANVAPRLVQLYVA